MTMKSTFDAAADAIADISADSAGIRAGLNKAEDSVVNMKCALLVRMSLTYERNKDALSSMDMLLLESLVNDPDLDEYLNSDDLAEQAASSAVSDYYNRRFCA